MKILFLGLVFIVSTLSFAEEAPEPLQTQGQFQAKWDFSDGGSRYSLGNREQEPAQDQVQPQESQKTEKELEYDTVLSTLKLLELEGKILKNVAEVYTAEIYKENKNNLTLFFPKCLNTLKNDKGRLYLDKIQACSLINQEFSLRCVQAVVSRPGKTRVSQIRRCNQVVSDAGAYCVEDLASDREKLYLHRIENCSGR